MAISHGTFFKVSISILLYCVEVQYNVRTSYGWYCVEVVDMHRRTYRLIKKRNYS